ncbi:universal stress protein [Siccirubricoccus phaeus]|uniref:universal stress protein n=1 Tax=Siccirubricoccus phaeus TaxID=2595053 RepID=UPI00165AC24D|nr:universal stress protein [Siccirubricoccus phaeus]
MASPSWTTPGKILLATDLSSRCDRALDRAAQLAGQWQARLLVLHAMDPAEAFLEARRLDYLPTWRRPPDPARLVEAQIRRDLREQPGDVAVRVETGMPAAVIEEVAQAEGCGLIVTGVARDESLGRQLLGTTVDRLVRRSTIPILTVKSRLRPYDEIVVATDFSDPSRQALEAAAKLFPRSAITLLHAFEMPFAGLLDRHDLGDRFRALEVEACDEFLAASALSEEVRRRVRVLIEHGPPEAVIRAYLRERNVNLVVLGTHGRSAAFDILIGSTAKGILHSAPADVLLIRQPQ